MIEEVRDGDLLLAMILRDRFDKPGVTFVTPNEWSQQLAYMHHPAGKAIDPHVHNAVPRQIEFTQEVLIIKEGKLRVDFYSADRTYLHSRVLETGDVILLATGGHGFHVLEEVRMLEVKQGPYCGDMDKTRFAPPPSRALNIVVDTNE